MPYQIHPDDGECHTCEGCGQPLLLGRPGRTRCARCRETAGEPIGYATLGSLPLTEADRAAIEACRETSAPSPSTEVQRACRPWQPRGGYTGPPWWSK